MIAANGVTARFLSAKNSPSICRVVRTPKRWERIVEIAADHKFQLPELPIQKRWRNFSSSKKRRIRCVSPTLAVIKLLGAGEYVAELPEGNVPVILVWQSRTTLTRQLQIAAIPTCSLSAC